MSAAAIVTSPTETGRDSSLLIGGWEVGLLVIMGALYLAGLYLNPAFFGSADALVLGHARRLALWRDGGRHDFRAGQPGA